MTNTEKLKKNKEFYRLYKKGNFYIGRIMVIYILPNYKDNNRLGISTVKNYGSSVLRNRMRRLVRESYRHMENDIATGRDIVFLIKKKTKGNLPAYRDVEKEMKYLLKKLGILK